MDMIEKIQLTALLFTVISFVFITATKDTDLHIVVIITGLTMFFGGMLTALVTTLMVIWL